MTDPIADLLTRIRNALMRGKATVNAPYSKVKHELSKLLVKEGFLTSVKKVKKKATSITLKDVIAAQKPCDEPLTLAL